MYRTIRLTLTVLAVLLAFRADGRERAKKDAPQPVGVELRLVVHKDTYAPTDNAQASPVDMKVEVKNVSKDELHFLPLGDDSASLSIDLQGPGAVSRQVNRMFTQEARGARPIVVPAGKSSEFPLKSLAFGFRSLEHAAYWTKPGEYSLTVRFATSVGFRAESDESLKLVPAVLVAKPVKVTVK
jgi:hypothetical protein